MAAPVACRERSDSFPLHRGRRPYMADFVAKVFFALVIKISFGCTRDFRVNMWGTSLPEDKLAGDLGNVIGATSIGGRRSDFFYSKKIGAGQFGTFTTISARTRPTIHRGRYLLIEVKRTAMLRRGNACF